ncbi:uncharacterized protein LOC135389475 [Ornithodoros turicata]|uniref:uncharacterized protein LOC135389475 n=1 Tax=Ornithodoros turicata TaxID=34597 RepID=UPI003139BB4A
MPDDLSQEYDTYCQELPLIEQLSVKRYVMEGIGENIFSVQLHTFTDASPTAYGACVYLRVEDWDANVSVNLVFAMSRVAPLKKLTLPRLELMGALIGARLAQYIEECLKLHIHLKQFWPGSTIALHWIQEQANRWKPFVCNRTTEIQSKTDPHSWSHCPGCQNPADMLTLGLTLEALVHGRDWWKGPEWLSEYEGAWPNSLTRTTAFPQTLLYELRRSEVSCLQVSHNTKESLMDPSSFSEYSRLLHVTAWTLRFIENCHQSHNSLRGMLTTDEIKKAALHWFKRAQHDAYAPEIQQLTHGEQIGDNSSITNLRHS